MSSADAAPAKGTSDTHGLGVWVAILVAGALSSLFFNIRDAFLTAGKGARVAAAAAERAGASQEHIDQLLKAGPRFWDLAVPLMVAVVPILFAALLSHTFGDPVAGPKAKKLVVAIFIAAMLMSLKAHLEVITPSAGPVAALGIWLIADTSALIALNMITKTIAQRRRDATIAALSSDIERQRAAMEADMIARLQADMAERRSDMASAMRSDIESAIASDMAALRSDMELAVRSDIAALRADMEAELQSDMEDRQRDLDLQAARREQALEEAFGRRQAELEEQFQRRRTAVQEELQILRQAASRPRLNGGGPGRAHLEIEAGAGAGSGSDLGPPTAEEKRLAAIALLKVDPSLSGAEIARLLSEKWRDRLESPLAAKTGQRLRAAAEEALSDEGERSLAGADA
ncbi:hypothetical protein [Nonomuraea typhae]|uniref:hypothetical protein n=1 Tax=Nonomuraea typhae TaxID=2603600 RepID=UPI0012F8235B|nr:hypothetical protein [Nonomuraea typhae]